jgi:hypothetical protein
MPTCSFPPVLTPIFLSYSLRSHQSKELPLSLSACVDYQHNPHDDDVIVEMAVTYANTSSTMKLTGISSKIPLFSLQSIASVSHVHTGDSIKDSCAVSACMGLGGTPEVRIQIPKLKPESRVSFTITLHVRSSHHSLLHCWQATSLVKVTNLKEREQQMESSFTIVPSKQLAMISRNSPFSLVALRYATISSSSSTSVPPKILIQLKLTYQMTIMRSSVNETHHGLDELQTVDTRDQDSSHIPLNTVHHYTNSQMELYWSGDEEEGQQSDSESGDDAEKEILIHRTIADQPVRTPTRATSSSQKPRFAGAKVIGSDSPSLNKESTAKNLSITAEVVETPTPPIDQNLTMSLSEEFSKVSESDHTVKSRPPLQIQLSSVSLVDEPIHIEPVKREIKRPPPPLPPPQCAAMRGIKKKGTLPSTAISPSTARISPRPGTADSPSTAPKRTGSTNRTAPVTSHVSDLPLSSVEKKTSRRGDICQKKRVISLTIEPNSPEK